MSTPDPVISEARPITLLSTSETSIFDQLFLRHSSLKKIIRIIAYCIRVFTSINPLSVKPSPSEQRHVLEVIILAVQKQSFSDELRYLKDQNHQGQSKQRALNPFLDVHSIIRVGGRLSHADLPYEQKHLILLPRSHRITDLIIDDYHQDHKHPGATTIQSIIQQQYWIVASR